MLYSEEVAIGKALYKLIGHSSTWFKTKQLLFRIKDLESKGPYSDFFSKLEHLEFRNVLNKLYRLGVISRHGVGSFMWKWIAPTGEFEYDNPFKKLSTAPEISYTDTKSTSKSMPKIGGYKPAVNVSAFEKADVKEEEENSSKFTKAHADLINSLVTAVGSLAGKQKKTEETLEKLSKTCEEIALAAKASVKVIEVKHYTGKALKLKDKVLPKVFDQVFDLAKCRRNILLVGPAGCGKSHLAELIAETMMLDYGSLSCTAGMSEAHLLGRSIPDLTNGKNRFQGTEFLTRYEEGGVFLLDELDAADPNLLLTINTALANNYCNVPNRSNKPKAEMHEDFILIATANTFGKGATRQYAGRNQLDEATLDRFRIGTVEMDYDLAVEMALCPDDELRQACQDIRSKIQATGLRRIMSTRFMRDAYVMLKRGNWTKEKCLEVFFSGWSPEEKAKVQ